MRLAPPVLVNLVILTMLTGIFFTTPANALHPLAAVVTLEHNPQTLVNSALILNSFFFTNITIRDAVDVFTWQVTVTYDPAVLNIQAVILGSYWNQCNDADFSGTCDPGEPLLYQFFFIPDNTVGKTLAVFTFLTGLGQDPVPLTATAPTAMVRIRWQVKSNLASSSIHIFTDTEDFVSGTGVADSEVRRVHYNTEDGFFSNIAGLSAPDARFTVTPTSPDVYPNATVGTSVSFDGSTSLNGTSFSWDFGDGAPAGTGSTTSHTYNPTNNPPTVSFTEDASTVKKGVPINITVAESDPERFITRTIIDWGDGTVNTFPGEMPPPRKIGHSYSRAGIFRVNVTATDLLPLRAVLTVNGPTPGTISKASKMLIFSPGQSRSMTADKIITTDLPALSFTEDKSVVRRGETITLTISASDSDGSIASTLVNWGDGTVLTFNGESAVYDSNSDGLYSSSEPVIFGTTPSVAASTKDDASVRYADTNSNSVRDTGESVVYDANGNGAYNTGELVIFGPVPSAGTIVVDDPKVRYVDSNGDNVWNNGVLTGTSHAYSVLGGFTVTVTVTDNDGETVFVTSTKTVQNVRPTISFTPDKTTALTGETVTITVTGSDADGSIASTSINWGDGTVQSFSGLQTTASYTYSDNGLFTVAVTLTDNEAGATTASSQLTIQNRAPAAGFSFSPASPTAADTVSFTDSSTDPDGSASSWSWDFGDGTSSTERNPTHKYTRAATFTVTLTVTDNDGATNTFTRTIIVGEAPSGVGPLLPWIAGGAVGLVAIGLIVWRLVLAKRPQVAIAKPRK